MNCRAIFLFFTLLTLEMYIINGEGLVHKLQKAKTAEEFLSNVEINGRPATLSDVYFDTSKTDENGNPMYVSGGGALQLAKPDDCSPRLTTVAIPRASGDYKDIYWPTCTRIKRCGGCCASNLLKCYPTRTKTVELHVLKASLPYPGALKLAWNGSIPVFLESHTACSPVCRLSAKDCNAKQTFSDFDCMCRCVIQRPCHPLQVWDESTCSCKCKKVLNCAPSIFNPVTCACEIINGGNGNGDVDPCLTQFCPPRFTKRVDPQNPKICLCTPPFFSPGRK